MTEPLFRAAKKLIAEILAEPPPVDYRHVTVSVPNENRVPEGTVVLAEARTCICGVSFIPTIWNQINHTPACAKLRARIKARGK
jgi:hypothetical protein